MKKMKAKPITMIIILSSLISTLIISCSSGSGAGSSSSLISTIANHEITGSTNHNPNSTWWGYNMSKIVRHNNIVYIGVVQNDSSDGSVMGDFKIFRSIDNTSFAEIASFPTSRPGNIVIDASGEIHVFTFEAFNPAANDSIGSLVVNSSSGAATATPTFNRQVIVNATNSNDERVNIRIGASISDSDTLAVSYGLNQFNPVTGTETVQLHIKDGASWRTETFTSFPSGDATEYYYPMVSFDSNENVYVFPVQDEYHVPSGGGPATNIYHKIPYLRYDNASDSITFKMIQDESGSALAATEDSIFEQKDIFHDTVKNETLFIYRQKTSADEDKIMMTKRSANGTTTDSELTWATQVGANWVRLFRHEGQIYAAVNSWKSFFFANLETGAIKELSIAIPQGSYIYIPSPRGGTAEDLQFLDLMVISGNSADYPGAKVKVLTFDKNSIKSLF